MGLLVFVVDSIGRSVYVISSSPSWDSESDGGFWFLIVGKTAHSGCIFVLKL